MTELDPYREAKERWAKFSPPPVPHADKMASLLARVERMTPDEVFRSSVAAGIHNLDGSLTEHYRAP